MSYGMVVLIAFRGGLYALPSIGHGKVGKGIAILVDAIILYVVTVL
jgi:hypothetical protein